MNQGWNYLTGGRTFERGVVTIYEYERGLLYQSGILKQVLEAGRYRLWSWQRARIDIVDIRRQSAQITNQKLLTSDQVTVTLNVVADYEISDVALSAHRVVNAQSQLYEDVQLATRNVVGAVDVNTLLENRTGINDQIQQAVVPLAAAYGLTVINIGIKDVILAPKIRDILLKEVEAKRMATAMLIGAREEVAALRALANAAQLIEKNPALLRLRELDVARSFAEKGGNTVVMGVGKEAISLRSTRNDTAPEPVSSQEEI
jgi:regulator of protease activity HflC (stomatin/prohibitin superfamily)